MEGLSLNRSAGFCRPPQIVLEGMEDKGRDGPTVHDEEGEDVCGSSGYVMQEEKLENKASKGPLHFLNYIAMF